MKKLLTILLLLFLLQGCSSTPEKGTQYYFSESSFFAGVLVIPNASSDNDIDDALLGVMSREYKYKNWHNLAMSAFDTLNPQDLTYFYLGSAAEGLKHHKIHLFLKITQNDVFS